MIILGIDPGYATLGYGIIEFKNAKYNPIHYGAIITSPKSTFSERLEIREVNRAFCLSDGGREYPCYEFVCRSGENGDVRVYVNSQTGAEEKIVLVSDTETGTFFD